MIATRSQATRQARRSRARLALACAGLASLLVAGAARAQTEPAETATPPTETTAAPAAANTAAAADPGTAPATSPTPLGAARSARLIEARVRPRIAYVFGMKKIRFTLRVKAKAPINARIEIVRKNGTVERSLSAVLDPASRSIVPWDGLSNLGTPLRGKFTIVVKGPDGRPIPIAKRYASAKRGGSKTRFGLYDHIFPIRGKHTYGDGIGAPRGDHTHQGQDISAPCGTRLVAAQGGTVQVNAFQAGGAGYYVVIDTAGSDIDHVYMHLAGPSPIPVGGSVPTGLYFAQVGNTGSSSGCHLHFEMWSGPGWYEGGAFMDPSPFLRAWDKFS